MACCNHVELIEDNERIFAVDPTAIRFGPKVLEEIGHDVKAMGSRRVGVFSDNIVAGLEAMETINTALSQSDFDLEIFDEVRIEPLDRSFIAASRFASEGDFEGLVPLGGGSGSDSCKAANLYATYPADFIAYVNAPIGAGQPVPGALKPHVACPTTSGTGSECTGIAVGDLS